MAPRPDFTAFERVQQSLSAVASLLPSEIPIGLITILKPMALRSLGFVDIFSARVSVYLGPLKKCRDLGPSDQTPASTARALHIASSAETTPGSPILNAIGYSLHKRKLFNLVLHTIQIHCVNHAYHLPIHYRFVATNNCILSQR